VHPATKTEVGLRMASLMNAVAYNSKEVHNGPSAVRAAYQNNSIAITFDLHGSEGWDVHEGQNCSYSRHGEVPRVIPDYFCKGFEDYAQAKYKASGEPTIIRLMTHEGNMNPLMSQVDMVPDEDLNTKLKFYCENQVEDMEDTILEMFAEEGENRDVELCSKRSKYCEPMELPQEEYEFEKEEL